LLVEIQIPSVRKPSVADGLSIQEILENWLKLNEFNELNESGQRCLLRSMDNGKDGGHGADPGCLLDARACVGSHGFAAGVSVLRIPCLSVTCFPP